MKEKEFEVTIVGGGIVGLMVATLILIRQPKTSIAIIDKEKIGNGVSAYSAGLSTSLAKSQLNKTLLKKSINIIKEIQQHVPVNLIEKKSFNLVDTKNKDHFCDLYNESDLEQMDLSQFKNHSLSHCLHIPKNKIILHSKNLVHHVDPYHFIEKLSFFLRQNGCHIFETCKVNNIKQMNNEVLINCDNDIKIKTAKLISTIGPWQNKPNFLNFIPKSQFQNKKVAAFHIPVVPKNTDPVILLFEEEAFFLPLFDKGYWLFSFTSNDWDCDPDSNIIFSENDLIIAKNILNKFNIDFESFFLGGRAYCDSYSKKKEFCLEKNGENIIIVNGASGSGYRFSYGIADQVAREIINEKK